MFLDCQYDSVTICTKKILKDGQKRKKSFMKDHIRRSFKNGVFGGALLDVISAVKKMVNMKILNDQSSYLENLEKICYGQYRLRRKNREKVVVRNIIFYVEEYREQPTSVSFAS